MCWQTNRLISLYFLGIGSEVRIRQLSLSPARSVGPVRRVQGLGERQSSYIARRPAVHSTGTRQRGPRLGKLPVQQRWTGACLVLAGKKKILSSVTVTFVFFIFLLWSTAMMLLVDLLFKFCLNVCLLKLSIPVFSFNVLTKIILRQCLADFLKLIIDFEYNSFYIPHDDTKEIYFKWFIKW